jgi:hypothetical protein
MTFHVDWQSIIVFLLVSTAVTHLVGRAWRLFAATGSRAGCGSCGQCPSSATRPLVTIDLAPIRPQTNRTAT